jgi:glycosyltransferase involved in cell wall biosynthesis
MSTGCLVVGSDTPPVTELIQDGENGLLVDFFSPKKIAERIYQVLEHPTRLTQIRANARKTVLERYALADLLPQHLQLIKNVANHSRQRG